MRYQKIESKIWFDEKFIKLSPMQQRLFFYILTCPHGNLLGLFVLKKGYILDDLNCFPSDKSLTKDFAKDLDKDLESLCESGLICIDKNLQVVWIINFLKHNPITNPNQRKSALKILTDLPKSKLIQKFLVLNEGLREGLSEGLSEVLSKPETETETEAGTKTETETETEENSPLSPRKRVEQKISSISSKPLKTFLPENFAISPEVKIWADKNNHRELERHLEAFIELCKSNGYTAVDWDCKFKRAIREDWGRIHSGNGRDSPGYGPSKTDLERGRQWAIKRDAEREEREKPRTV